MKAPPHTVPGWYVRAWEEFRRLEGLDRVLPARNQRERFRSNFLAVFHVDKSGKCRLHYPDVVPRWLTEKRNHARFSGQ